MTGNYGCVYTIQSEFKKNNNNIFLGNSKIKMQCTVKVIAALWDRIFFSESDFNCRGHAIGVAVGHYISETLIDDYIKTIKSIDYFFVIRKQFIWNQYKDFFLYKKHQLEIIFGAISSYTLIILFFEFWLENNASLWFYLKTKC